MTVTMAPTLLNTFAEAFNEFATGVDGDSSSSSASAVPEASTALEVSTTLETSRPSAQQLALYTAVYPDDDHSAATDASAVDIKEALLEAREGNLCGTLSPSRQIHTQSRESHTKYSFFRSLHEDELIHSLI